ncbi:MAG: hypothetical protein OXH28_01505 [bacterium]|nr:hypothetical protein [bacterium]
MEISQLEFIIAWVSILGTTLGAVLGAFGFLLREMRRGFDRHEARMDRQDEKLEQITDLRIAVARIEGHLGIGFPATGDQRPGDEPPGRAA